MIKRLKILLLIFCLALSMPLAYFVIRTYQGLEQEEVATLSYFAETLFDDMERALARWAVPFFSMNVNILLTGGGPVA